MASHVRRVRVAAAVAGLIAGLVAGHVIGEEVVAANRPSSPPIHKLPLPVQRPATAAQRAAFGEVVRVVTDARANCHYDSIGSGWPAATDTIVTNAHVVAGGDAFHVDIPGGRTLPATVVAFDPVADIAILHVPGLGLTPLPISADQPQNGTPEVTIGYPGGKDETMRSAEMLSRVPVPLGDIYGNRATRDVEGLDADITNGNSGGPVVNAAGRVEGMVFATFITDPHLAMAIPTDTLRAALAAADGRRAAVPVTSGKDVCVD